jgi:hypothetical protein
MQGRRCASWAASSLITGALALATGCTAEHARAQPVQVIQISPRVKVALAPRWKALPATPHKPVELVLEKEGREAARVSASVEPRVDHAEALRRLREIAGERPGEGTFTEICGWPALERMSRVPLARLRQQQPSGKPFQPGEAMVDTVTVAIAESDAVVRIEGLIAPGFESADDVLQLGRTLSCSANAHPAEARQEIESLRSAPPR